MILFSSSSFVVRGHVRSQPFSGLTISAELASHNIIRARLIAEIPDIDPETLADTLRGLTDLRETLAEVIRSALDDEALAAGLSTRLSDMKALIERFQMRAKRKRELALKVMNEAEMPKLTVDDFTASLRQGAPALEVVEEAKDSGCLLEATAAEARSPGSIGSAQGRHSYRGRGSGTGGPTTQCKD